MVRRPTEKPRGLCEHLSTYMLHLGAVPRNVNLTQCLDMTSKIDKVRVIINFLVSNFLQKWAGNLIKLFTSFNIFAFVRAVCCATPNGYMVWWYMLAMILNSWWTLVWIKINSFSPLILISVIFTVCHTFPLMTVLRIWGLLTNNAL